MLEIEEDGLDWHAEDSTEIVDGCRAFSEKPDDELTPRFCHRFPLLLAWKDSVSAGQTQDSAIDARTPEKR